MRVGIGYDVHRLAGGVPFLLGGVRVPFPRGAVGHSDGDALLHALIDAMLGAAALGDIGVHFPPGHTAWRGADSRDLLRRAGDLVRQAGYQVHNIDATVILERPRLQELIPDMRRTIAEVLGMDISRVSIKAKSNEGLDAVGNGRAVAAHAVVLLEEP